MDTPVRLTSKKAQVTFFGNISNRSLQGLTRQRNSLITAAIKWVLGKDFIDDIDRYHVNTDIFSRFVASLLDAGTSNYLTTKLTKMLFPSDYLGGL